MSSEPALIATHSGLRGRTAGALSPERVQTTVAGFLRLLRDRDLPPIVGLARDARPSGEQLARTVTTTAASAGIDVADFGVLSSPGAKLAARRRGLGGLVVVTGSHLGPEWNGLKLVAAPDWSPVDIRLLPEAPATTGNGRRGSVQATPDGAGEHADAVCASVDREAIASAGLRVSVDGGAGPAASIALESLGCELVAEGGDVGLILDADGDRLQLADGRGRRLDEELTLPLAALARGATRIVKGADTSRMVDVLAADRGGWVRVVPPGELHLLRWLSAEGAEIAGEGNGGVVVPEVVLARDGLAAGAAIIELLAKRAVPLGELAAELPSFERRRSTLPCASLDAAHRALGSAAKHLRASAGDADHGIRLEREGGAWAMIRQSATEPVLRLTVEAVGAEQADELHSELRAALAA